MENLFEGYYPKEWSKADKEACHKILLENIEVAYDKVMLETPDLWDDFIKAVREKRN